MERKLLTAREAREDSEAIRIKNKKREKKEEVDRKVAQKKREGLAREKATQAAEKLIADHGERDQLLDAIKSSTNRGKKICTRGWYWEQNFGSLDHIFLSHLMAAEILAKELRQQGYRVKITANPNDHKLVGGFFENIGGYSEEPRAKVELEISW